MFSKNLNIYSPYPVRKANIRFSFKSIASCDRKRNCRSTRARKRSRKESLVGASRLKGSEWTGARPAGKGTPAVFKPVPPRAKRPLAPLSAIIKTCRLLQHSYVLLNQWSPSSFDRLHNERMFNITYWYLEMIYHLSLLTYLLHGAESFLRS